MGKLKRLVSLSIDRINRGVDFILGDSDRHYLTPGG